MGKYNFDEIIDRENSDSLKYNWRERIFGKEDIIPLWVADMDFKSPDFCIKAIEERLSHPVLGYYSYPDSFYDSIIWWMKKRHQWEIKKDWIYFSPGVVPALSAAVLAYTNEGDNVLVQTPVYHPFYYSIANQKRNILKNPLKLVDERFEMDFEDLEEKLKQGVKLMLFCNPHNPLARAWEKDVLERIGKLCLKYNCIVVSDEIHSDLILPNYSHNPMAKISKEISNNTITLMAPSKTFNLAGLATAEVIIENKTLRKRFTGVLYDSLHLFSGNVFGMVALQAAYSEEGEEWLVELLEYIQGNLELLRDYISKNHPRIKLLKHEATYLAWMDFSNYNLSHKELMDVLVNEAKLGFNDGEIFGEEGKMKMRINLALPRQKLAQALSQLKVIEKY